MSELGQSERVLLLLGEAFREIREQHGLSAGELSGATGVARARIVALEGVVFGFDRGVLAEWVEREMGGVGIDYSVSDEGRGELKQDAVVGQHRGDHQQRRRKQQGRRREPEMDSERMGETAAVSYASGTTKR